MQQPADECAPDECAPRQDSIVSSVASMTAESDVEERAPEVDRAMEQALADGARPGCPALQNAQTQLKAIAKAAEVDAAIASP